MSKSPGHQKWPNHRVIEHHLKQKIVASVNGGVLADSDDVIRVDEDGHPARYYFPRGDVRMDQFHGSAKTTQCPFKGSARHFDVTGKEGLLRDAAWSYEDPYDEHADLKDRVAFYDVEMPAIEVKIA